MRAGVLSNDQTIEFLNEHFINTWVTNSELGRIRSLREPIAKRREREAKTFDTTHPLAQAIIKGWKTGAKKSSPVDCFVISPAFELMGRQLVNELGEDSKNSGLQENVYYLTFLQKALADKQPGLGNIILNSEHPSQEVLDTFQTPIGNHQNYTTVVIDTRAFQDSGTLIIDIEVGRGDADGTFFLVNGDMELRTEEGITKDDNLASVWSEPGETGRITHCFDQGQLFKLCVTGYSDEEEAFINAFRAKISVAAAN